MIKVCPRTHPYYCDPKDPDRKFKNRGFGQSANCVENEDVCKSSYRLPFDLRNLYDSLDTLSRNCIDYDYSNNRDGRLSKDSFCKSESIETIQSELDKLSSIILSKVSVSSEEERYTLYAFIQKVIYRLTILGGYISANRWEEKIRGFLDSKIILAKHIRDHILNLPIPLSNLDFRVVEEETDDETDNSPAAVARFGKKKSLHRNSKKSLKRKSKRSKRNIRK